MKIYFTVSDIHSFYSELRFALNKHGFDPSNREHCLIICGDAFDRGDFSLELLNWMKQLNEQNRLVYVRGNHEDLLEDLVFDIRKRKHIGQHHISNGTVGTIAQMIECSPFDILSSTFDWNVFDSRMNELLDFINTNSVDYFELGDTIFVHGWVPTTCDVNQEMIVHENFRDGDWTEARWENGMEMFHFKLIPPNISTVVCGHWHTSFGWSRYKHIGSDWGTDAKFDTFISHDETSKCTIIALDGCTAYSRKMNCVVFDENGYLIT